MFEMSRIKKGRFNSVGWVLFAMVLLPSFLYSQIDSLRVKFQWTRIDTNESLAAYGLKPLDSDFFAHADFYYPILSKLEVRDQRNLIVHGLADTSRWLDPEDAINRDSNLKVSDVWQTMLEYHRYNSEFFDKPYPGPPENNILSSTQNRYKVLETMDGDSVTLILCLDWSGSFNRPYVDGKTQMQVANEAAVDLVNHFSSKDRGAVVRFGFNAYTLQDVTGNKDSLIAAINTRFSKDTLSDGRTYRQDFGTCLFEGVKQAIDEARKVGGHRYIVLFSDGENKVALPKAELDVMRDLQSAIDYNKDTGDEIPIISILMDEWGEFNDEATHQDTAYVSMKSLADSSDGGFFVKKISELKDTYWEIYSSLVGSYWLVHESTDPFFNGTWRTLDASLRFGDAMGQDSSFYYVPLKRPDIDVEKWAEVDSMDMNTGVPYIRPGENIDYYIRVENRGVARADTVWIWDDLPVAVTNFAFQQAPDSVSASGDRVGWSLPGDHFNYLDTGDIDTIRYSWNQVNLNVNARMNLKNWVTGVCRHDSATVNNSDTCIVVYRPWAPVDLEVFKSSQAHSPQGEMRPEGVVFPRDTITYTLTVRNLGEFEAVSTTVRDTLPDNVRFVSSTSQALNTVGHVVVWTVPDILPYDRFTQTYYSETVSFKCVLNWRDAQAGDWVINEAVLFNEDDNEGGNDRALDSLDYHFLRLPDIQVEKTAIGSYKENENQTYWSAKPGDQVQFNVLVTNVGQLSSEPIQVMDVLPFPLRFVSFSEEVYTQRGDTLWWTVAPLDSMESAGPFTYTCRLDTDRVDTPYWVWNQATAITGDDGDPGNNTGSDSILYVPLTGGDIFIDKSASADFIQSAKTYVYHGGYVDYSILLRNIGELPCSNITVTDVLPEYLTYYDTQTSQAKPEVDTLTWSIPYIAARGGEETLQYRCVVDSEMPFHEVALMNAATVSTPDDTTLGNNTDQDTVYAVPQIDPTPTLRVEPKLIEPGESVRVYVNSPIAIQAGDWTLYESIPVVAWIDSIYYVNFYNTNGLSPDVETRCQPDLSGTITQMRSDRETEWIAVKVCTWDQFGDGPYCAADSFAVESSNGFFLEENTFKVSEKSVLAMQYKLSSNRPAKIVIYDIAGGFVATPERGDTNSSAGWNRSEWDGNYDDGTPAGSGIYIAILTTEGFQKMRKFILVR